MNQETTNDDSQNHDSQNHDFQNMIPMDSQKSLGDTSTDQSFHLKPWYTAYDFPLLRQQMTPEEQHAFQEGKDRKGMKAITTTILLSMRHGTQKNIKIACPHCGANALSIMVSNGLFHCWKCEKLHGQLRELSNQQHGESSRIDTLYYQRAKGKGTEHRDPDYTPLVATDYEPVEAKTLARLYSLDPQEGEPQVAVGDKLVRSLRSQVRHYLADMGIDVDTARRGGVMCSWMSLKTDDSHQEDPTGYRIVPAIAYCNRIYGNIVNVKLRSVDQDDLTHAYSKEFCQVSPTKPCAPYGIDSINPLRPEAEPIGRLIFTEGEKDRLTLMQCGFPYVLSVASGAGTDLQKSHEAFEEWIAQAKEIVVCGDQDRKGRTLVRHLLSMYADSALLAELPQGCKDVSELYARFGADEVRRVILEAKELGVEEVYTVADHEQEIMQVMMGHYDRGYSIGMGELTDHVLHLNSGGGLIVVSGVPNSGKTDFLNCVMAHLIFQRQKRVGFFSFELPDKAKHFTTMVRLAMGTDDLSEVGIDHERGRKDERLSERMLEPVLGYLDQHMVDFRMETSLPTPSYILGKAERLRRKRGLDFLVIDPYMFIVPEEGKERLTETQQIKEMLTRVQAWGRKNGVWTVIVAHPRMQHRDGTQTDLDFYEIASSANWANLADFIFTVRRVNDPQSCRVYTKMQVLKVRDQELCSVGEVLYTRQECGRYDEREDETECMHYYQGDKCVGKDTSIWV